MDEISEKSPFSVGYFVPRFWRRRWWVISCALVGWTVGSALGWLLPAKYRSETVILIEQQKVPEHLVEPNVSSDLQQRLQSMSEQILSRTRLLGIIDKFQLYDKDRHRLDSDSLVEQMRKDITIDTIKGDGVRRNELSAFKLSYSSGSAVVAQQVTSELTSLFIQEDLRDREQLSEDTTAFLDSQLDLARKSLSEQEQRLKDFKSKYLGQLPEQMGPNLQILAGLQNQRQAANEALNQADQQRLYLQSLLTQYQAVRPASVNLTDGKSASEIPPVDLDRKLETLRAQLAEMSGHYTQLHPDVVRIKEQIAETEREKAHLDELLREQKKKNPAGQTQVSVSGDPQTTSAMAQVQSQLRANELEIANRKSEIQKLDGQIEAYQQRLNLTPEREQELAGITRDHEQSLSDYQSLLARRNQSEIATNLEKRQQGEQFRMIDPPSLPQKPYWPNRVLVCLSGLAFGIGLGLALVGVLEIANPRIYREEELRELMAVPVLITLPALPGAAELRRRKLHRVLEAVAVAIIFAVMPLVSLLIYYKG